MHGDGVVSRLLLLLLHRSNDADHAFPIRRDAHLRPAVEMELPHGTGPVLLGMGGRVSRSALSASTRDVLAEHSPCCW